MRFEEEWDELCAKIWFYRQSVTKYFAKNKKISKVWQDQGL